MRLFLTGATGFIGSWLLKRLLASGRHQVALLQRPGRRLSRLGLEAEGAEIIQGDLARCEDLKAPLAAFAPDAVIHLAWKGVMNANRDDLDQVDNIGWSVRLVDLAADVGASVFIGVGSQAEYGPKEEPISEETPERPATFYGHAKLSSARMTQYRCRQRGLRFAWARVFSTYGPGDHAGWFHTALIDALLKGEHFPMTPGTQTWDYLYVADAADALMALAESERAEGIFNLASGRSQTIRQVAEMVRDMIDPDGSLGIGEVPFRTQQVLRMEADISRLVEATGWRPVTSLQKGMEKTIEWQRRHAD